MKKLSGLEKLARAHGIQTSFIDSSGTERFVSDETLRAILERLGVDEEQKEERRVCEPVLVYWQGSRRPLKTVVREKPRRIWLELEEERGPRPLKDFRLGPHPDGFEVSLTLPQVPTGYHSLQLTTASGTHGAMLISAPRRIFAETNRQWGAFLPLYAAHSANSWGAGNLRDWEGLATWVGQQGGGVIGTLPLLAAFLDKPRCEPSPYSPASRLFWNEFFIDVTAIPEFRSSARAAKLVNSANFQRTLAGFRQSDLIDYREQWAARRQVLEILAREFFAGNSFWRAELNRYLRERPEVEDYARFRATCDRRGVSWLSWGKSAKEGILRSSDFDDDTRKFYLFSQWAAQQQVDEVLASCRAAGVKFYLDLPLGVNPDGFDAWRYRDFFAREVSAGAPPDAFFTRGQDWGFAPLDPWKARELHYRYVIEYLRFQMRHTGLLRIDHVMGLHRLWWVPHGYPASEGAYVRYRADELYAILSVESHRHKTMLVGENLGTVPPEVNESMDRHGLRRMYVLQYEQPVNGRLRDPEPSVVASVNTHDMPMFTAHWKGLDILDRFDLGLIPRKDLAREKRERAQLRKAVIEFLRKRRLLPKNVSSPAAVFKGILAYLAGSPAETVLVNLEDLWGEARSQNVPGTLRERPNWCRRAALSLEELQSSRQIAEMLAAVKRSVKRR